MRTSMKTKETTIWIMAPVLAISIGFLVLNAAADPYPKPFLVFLVVVADWSDGTPAGKHND